MPTRSWNKNAIQDGDAKFNTRKSTSTNRKVNGSSYKEKEVIKCSWVEVFIQEEVLNAVNNERRTQRAVILRATAMRRDTERRRRNSDGKWMGPL